MTLNEIKEACNEAERSEQARAARAWSEERLITLCNPLVTMPVSIVYALVECAALSAQAQEILYAAWQDDLIGCGDGEESAFERRVLRELMLVLPRLGETLVGAPICDECWRDREESE